MTTPLREKVRFILHLTDDEMTSLAIILDTVLRDHGIAMSRLVAPILAACDQAQEATQRAEATLRAQLEAPCDDDGQRPAAANKLH